MKNSCDWTKLPLRSAVSSRKPETGGGGGHFLASPQERPLRSPSDGQIMVAGTKTQTKEDRTSPCPHVWPRTTRPGQR
jgi:hypothetical protein